MSKETKQHGVKTRPFTIDPPTLWPRGQHTKCIWLTKEGEAKARRSFRFGLLVNTSQSRSRWPHHATSNVVWIVFLCWVQCNTRISHKSHHKPQETVRSNKLRQRHIRRFYRLVAVNFDRHRKRWAGSLDGDFCQVISDKPDIGN